MKNFSRTDYSFLDSPEVLTYIFHPRPEIGVSDVSAKVINIKIPVEDNVAIGGRFYVNQSVAPNILFFHGNGEIVADYNDLGPMYNQMGINFLPVDYRGYGKSNGTPTVTGMMKDCHVILEYIQHFLADRGFSGPLVLMGRSLGSASALELAAHYPGHIKGLIVESGFAYTGPLLSLLGVNLQRLDFEEKKGFGNLDKIKAFNGPTLIIHAEMDHIIPFSDGQALFDASPASQKFLLKISKANHNDIFLHGFKEYMTEIKNLMDKLV
ncbi:MAG: alpha/beta hydrolase [Desulfobacterales bacterium]